MDPVLLLCFILIFFGAVAQGACGVGIGLVAGPFIAMLMPELLPGPMLVIMVVAASWTAVAERDAIEFRWAGVTLLGRIPGIFLGAWMLALMSPRTFAWIFALTVLSGVIVSLVGPKARPTTRILGVSGFISGIMGTITSIGSPPTIFAIQHGAPRQVRATLSLIFALGSSMSIGGLVLFEQFGWREMILGLAILPPMLLGIWCARWLKRYVDRGALRPALLGMAALAAPLLILRAAMME